MSVQEEEDHSRKEKRDHSPMHHLMVVLDDIIG